LTHREAGASAAICVNLFFAGILTIVIPAMKSVRQIVDQLEKVLPDDYWPLPSYRDMLFIK
jgi:glutamine synthetase type III